MNQSQDNKTDALRSDIDVTRRRMDETIDALGDRMQPRHLLDEVLGYFRRTDSNGESRLSTMRDKVSHGTDTAVHAVVDTIKRNPMPALLIGAGVAWMIYNSRRDTSDSTNWQTDTGSGLSYDPDAHLDRPLDYPSGTAGISEAGWSETGTGSSDGTKSGIKDKIGGAAHAAKDKLSHAGEAARERFSAMRQRAGEFGTRVRERTGEMCSATGQRVATTANESPIGVGLACLAVGVLAGLAIPTPSPVNRRLGPTADRLRERVRESGQEYLEKGKRVATAAMEAVKQEAQAQGLTPERLREKAGAVADRAKNAGQEAARSEGIGTGNRPGTGSSMPEGNQSGSQLNDPTVARPAV